MGMNETCVKSIDSEQFLNGNEWDREGHGKNGILPLCFKHYTYLVFLLTIRSKLGSIIDLTLHSECNRLTIQLRYDIRLINLLSMPCLYILRFSRHTYTTLQSYCHNMYLQMNGG